MGRGETVDKGWQRTAYQRLVFYLPRNEDEGVGV